MDGIASRVGEKRPDMPWTEQTLDPELVALVKGFRTKQRPEISALLDRYAEGREILIFRTRESAERWLNGFHAGRSHKMIKNAGGAEDA